MKEPLVVKRSLSVSRTCFSLKQNGSILRAVFNFKSSEKTMMINAYLELAEPVIMYKSVLR